MGNVTNSRLPFTLTVNSLGEDIVKGEDTLTLVDEIKSPLQFELDSLVVKDKNGNTVQGVTARIEAVSYTHLDVYKRQARKKAEKRSCPGTLRGFRAQATR